MDCRKCGACCIAPSITGAIPNMPNGKPAGIRCANLTAEYECTLYGKPERPTFCIAWQSVPDVCGLSLAEAMRNIAALEEDTR